MYRFICMIAALKSRTDKHRGQVSEDERLQERYQYFYEINKYRKPDRHR